MSLPPVDSIDLVLKTPEPEKGRRVGTTSERRQGRSGYDRRKRAASGVAPDDADAIADPENEAVSPATESDDATSTPVEAYGPAADLRRDEVEHHSIDYRA